MTPDPDDVADDGFPAKALGWSRLLLFAGLGLLAVGDLLGPTSLAWAGVGLAALSMGLNAVGKLAHYRHLPIAPRARTVLSASWLLVALSVAGLLLTYARARYAGAPGAGFWPLLLVGGALALLHRGLRARFLPEADETEEAQPQAEPA